MNDMRAKLAALSPEKRALLLARLKKSRSKTIPPAENQTHGPLTPEQERLWFLDQKDGPSALYNVPILLKIKGTLDVPRLEAAAREIVKKHAVLRTRIRVEEGVPMMVADEHAELRLPLNEGSETDAKQLALQPFDLQNSQLLRLELFRIDSNEHVLLLNLHHIITDGWSNVLLLRDLFTAYENGPLQQTPEISYLDYSAWRRERLNSEEILGSLEWWQSKLNGVQPGYALLPDRRPPENGLAKASNYSFEIGSELAQSIRQAARDENTTVFSFLLAAFAAVSARYTGENERVIASPVANRRMPELEEVAGFFVNMIALRMKASPNATWRHFLKETSGTVVESLDNQEAPLERVLETLPHLRGGSRSPLLNTVFSLEKSSGKLSSAGLEIETLPLESDWAKFDFMLMIQDAPEAMHGHVEFDAGRYDTEMVAEFTRSLCAFLQRVTQTPDDVLSNIALGEKLPPPLASQKYESVVEAFRQHAARTPDAPALITSGGKNAGSTMSYAALDEASTTLAGQLQTEGICPGDAVGVCFSRSAEMIAALLGILKCGAMYVPLDPEYPEARLKIMAETAGLKRIVTEFEMKFSKLDVAVFRSTGRATHFVPVDISDEAGAYIMFTSGSTGEPKGVRIPHRGIVRLVQGQTYADFSAERRFLHISSISFDASTLEVWAPLLNGGACVLAADAHVDENTIANAVKKHGADSAWITASLFNHLVDHAPDSLRGLRQILTGGEALSVDHVRRAQELLPDTILINGYGPTENTTFTCCHRIEKPVPQEALTIPIGKAVSGTSVHILDEQLRPVPCGAVGELLTGGAGLAIGYEGREDFTREKFITLENGERVYRTGDMVRRRVDGTIEFLGRHDSQLKVRGFRIETAEVEKALMSIEGIRAAAVAANEEGQLIGYVVGDSAAGDSARTALAHKLPSYMVPNRIQQVGSLPRTRNGKLDTEGLRRAESKTSITRTPPETKSQMLLAEIWKEFLGLENACLEDDFFAAGGHSLLALRMFAEIEKRSGRRLPLAVLFESPTLGALAARLDESGDARSVVRMQTGNSDLSFFCIHAGDGGILFYRELAAELAGTCDVYGVEASWLAGGSSGPCTIEEVAKDYIAKIRQVQTHGPYRLGGFSFGGVVAFEMARQLESVGEKVELLVLFDTFNPANPPQRMTFNQRMRRNYRAAADRGVFRMGWYFISRALGKVVANFFKHREKARKVAADVMEHAGQEVPVDYQVIQAREAHIRAMWEYQPQSYAGGMLLYAAEEPLEGYNYPQDRGWGQWVRGKFEVLETPGAHPTILQQPHVKKLAESLREKLETTSRER